MINNLTPNLIGLSFRCRYFPVDFHCYLSQLVGIDLRRVVRPLEQRPVSFRAVESRTTIRQYLQFLPMCLLAFIMRSQKHILFWHNGRSAGLGLEATPPMWLLGFASASAFAATPVGQSSFLLFSPPLFLVLFDLLSLELLVLSLLLLLDPPCSPSPSFFLQLLVDEGFGWASSSHDCKITRFFYCKHNALHNFELVKLLNSSIKILRLESPLK